LIEQFAAIEDVVETIGYAELRVENKQQMATALAYVD